MAGNRSEEGKFRPAGYSALVERNGLDAIPNWHISYVAYSNTRVTERMGEAIEEVYPSTYWPGDSTGDHLEFALKYDGTNLAILAALFRKVDEDEMTSFIVRKPTGKYVRRLWYLYEFLTGKRLLLDDLTMGTYVDLLDSGEYYTSSAVNRIRRQRINENLLGGPEFCPMIRRTAVLREFEEKDLRDRCRAVVTRYPQDVLKRALGYLYTKETKSSFEIERITPGASRIERFVTLLQHAREEDYCTKERLVELQNRIVDERFREENYRNTQNYVGETVAWRQERIHYICPRPEDVATLMHGLLEAHQRMKRGGVPPVIHAAAIAYGFVFLHPFEDGNGRIHRFLVHNILSQRGFTPEQLMFPVSASMLRNPSDYDASLEAFSRPVMERAEYTLDDEGRLTVLNDTALCYRFIDMTPQAEALFRFIEQTIDVELPGELDFLMKYDRSKRAMQDILDMPDRKIDLFIRFCLQNNGRISPRKRAAHFDMLSDHEITELERVVRSAYEISP